MADPNIPSPPVPLPPPGAPNPKTSSVPLKKETVRITLRAKPGDTPEAAPVAPPVAPPAPPLRPAAPPPPMGRPAPPPAPIGSKTIPLTAPQPPRPAGAPGGPRPATAPLTGAAPTQPMPKPTVRLQPQPGPSGPGTTAVSSAPTKSAVISADDEEEINEGPLNIIAGIGLGLAAIFLAIALLSSDGVGLGIDPGGTGEGWKLPKADGKYARLPTDPHDTTVKSTFVVKEIPRYAAPAN